MVPHGAATRAAMLGPSAVLKKRSSIRACLCHRAPHSCGDYEGVPGEWSDVCGFLKLARSESEWQVQYAWSLHHPLTACWVPGKQIKVAITKLGSTSSTSMRDLSTAYLGKTRIVDQSRGRGTRRTTTQQGKQAESFVRDHSCEWYMSSV